MNTISIISKKYGSQKIDLNNYNPMAASYESPIFKMIEHIFDEWFAYRTQPGAPMAKDIKGMYHGEEGQPAIYHKRGAIVGGIENMIEEIKELGKSLITTKDLIKMDIEAAFE